MTNDWHLQLINFKSINKGWGKCTKFFNCILNSNLNSNLMLENPSFKKIQKKKKKKIRKFHT